MGAFRVSIARACTGLVCVRSTRWCSAGSVQKVSCIVRAGWSGPRLSASKLSHSASTSGPSATSQPIATKTSAIRSESIVMGCRAPGTCRSHGRVTSTVSSTSIRCSVSTSSSAWRFPSAWLTAPLAWPTRWPASLRAWGGSAPISRLASASGDRSPACSVRTRLSCSRSVAPAIAARACSRISRTCSSSSGVTCTGSYSELGPDIAAFLGSGEPDASGAPEGARASLGSGPHPRPTGLPQAG